MKLIIFAITLALLLAISIGFSVGLVFGIHSTELVSNDDIISAFSAVGGWVSAFGTVSAAVVALLLANRQEKLSSADRKKEIYDAFFHLNMHMMQKRQFANINHVSMFYRYTRDARIYFPSVQKEIQEYFDHCFAIASNNEANNGITQESSSQNQIHLKELDELSPQIEKHMLSEMKI